MYDYCTTMKERLERLKRVLSLEWGELADHLDISRSMLDHVRNGRRDFGPKAMRRLEQAEIEAGIKSRTQYAAPLVKESDGEYPLANEIREMLRDLIGVQKELNAMNERIDKMIKRIDGLHE